MSNAVEKKAKGKKYKQTKELVRLAINSGWTQTQIGNECRVGQSVVSSWKSGQSKGREDQLQKLIAEFGHKLRRKSFRVYWNFDPSESHTDKAVKFFRIEGRVIMDHIFHDLTPNKKTGKSSRNLPIRRLIVHDQGNGQYLLLKQFRLYLHDTNEVVECSVPGAEWVTEVVDSAPKNKEELINYVDTRYEELLEKFPSDAVTLPYLIRQSLLYAGESVDGIIDYPAKA